MEQVELHAATAFRPRWHAHARAPASLATDGRLLQPAGTVQLSAVGLEPTPLRTGAWGQRLRALSRIALPALAAQSMPSALRVTALN